ncbi:hypothetical protein CsSME_00047579 [Camellia sinensis var. sinensis]
MDPRALPIKMDPHMSLLHSAREKMLQLKYVVAECLKEGSWSSLMSGLPSHQIYVMNSDESRVELTA